jgi:DNA-binding LacI/PurR family transcriptional regulator
MGVESACRAAHAAPPEVRTVELDAESAANAIQAWRSLDPPVSAVCAYNDEVAQAVLAGLRILGLECPRDLAVVGADDIPLAKLASPPLTTVAIDHKLEAQRIVETVTAALNSTAAVDTPEAADMFRLVVRESV